MARSKRTRSPLSIGLVKVHFEGDGPTDVERIEALRMVRLLTEKSIREEDILARFNGVVFAILFPDTRLDRAQESLDSVKQAMDDDHKQIKSYLSVVSYHGGRINQDKLLEQAFENLNHMSPN
jgi:GGDEF domain-containing protein